MASDKLVQVSKQLGQIQNEIRQSSRDYSKNLPVVEKSNDLLGALYTYRLEFRTYTEKCSVYIDIKILEKFKKI